ncbi:MAG: CoA-binding protein [Polyangiaceae bacterium]
MISAPKGRVVDDREGLDAILAAARRIAVLGIKTEAQAGQPAFDVPSYLQAHGFEIVPVPVYYPEITTILGRPVFRTVAEVPGDVDVVNVFRKGADVLAHVDDILAKKPKVVWMQLGIRNDAAAARFVEAGIDVVQDRCILVDHSQWRSRNPEPR